jgi:hypothetical protein
MLSASGYYELVARTEERNEASIQTHSTPRPAGRRRARILHHKSAIPYQGECSPSDKIKAFKAVTQFLESGARSALNIIGLPFFKLPYSIQ